MPVKGKNDIGGVMSQLRWQSKVSDLPVLSGTRRLVAGVSEGGRGA